MAEELIADYLARLDAAAMALTPTRREELRAEVAEHIESALADAGTRDEATVRNVLDRLGRAEDIVEAEAEAGPTSLTRGTMPAAWPPTTQRGWGWVEVLGVLVLSLGSLVLLVIGPLVGLVFVWASDRWNGRQKWIATAIVLIAMVAQFVLIAALFDVGMHGVQSSPTTMIPEPVFTAGPQPMFTAGPVPSMPEGSVSGSSGGTSLLTLWLIALTVFPISTTGSWLAAIYLALSMRRQ